MNLKSIAYALNSETRLTIIKLLSENDLTAKEVFLKLKTKVKYRQYIHRDLEILRNSEIVSKYYDEKTKKLYYHLEKREIVIELPTQFVK